MRHFNDMVCFNPVIVMLTDVPEHVHVVTEGRSRNVEPWIECQATHIKLRFCIKRLWYVFVSSHIVLNAKGLLFLGIITHLRGLGNYEFLFHSWKDTLAQQVRWHTPNRIRVKQCLECWAMYEQVEKEFKRVTWSLIGNAPISDVLYGPQLRFYDSFDGYILTQQYVLVSDICVFHHYLGSFNGFVHKLAVTEDTRIGDVMLCLSFVCAV